MRHFVLVQDNDLDDAAVLSTAPETIEDELFRLWEGQPLMDWFPADAVFPVSPDFPRARRLYASQANTLGLLVVSKEFRCVLEEVGCNNIEYLPISITDHRGKLASADYCIVNALDPVDAMDREHSIYENNALIPSRVSTLEKLVLREDRLEPQLHLFRLTNAPQFHIVSDALRRATEKKKLKGMLFVPTEEFDNALYLY
jgi:hypothetical protein